MAEQSFLARFDNPQLRYHSRSQAKNTICLRKDQTHRVKLVELPTPWSFETEHACYLWLIQNQHSGDFPLVYINSPQPSGQRAEPPYDRQRDLAPKLARTARRGSHGEAVKHPSQQRPVFQRMQTRPKRRHQTRLCVLGHFHIDILRVKDRRTVCGVAMVEQRRL
eukprot:1325476-Prymnesium_polylepis.1